MATMQDIADGFAVLSKYEKEGMQAHIGGASHDIIFGSTAFTPEGMSAEDVAKLDELGWHWSDEYDCWCHFV